VLWHYGMKSTLVRLSSLLGFAGGLFVVVPAAAQPDSECEQDSDCGAGYECTVTGVSGCAGAATPIDCAPDDEECLMPPPPECETMEYRSCVPLSGCESDADCAENMVCLSYEMGSCSDVACAPGEDCPDIEPVCETSVQTQCTERWNAPCESAADCGDGFECEYVEECSCSGGVNPSEPAMPPMMPLPDEGDEADGAEADAEDPPEAALPAPVTPEPVPPDEPVCECQPAAFGSCKVVEVECEQDSDCPSDWSCEQQYRDAPCGAPTEPTMMGGGTAGTGASGAEDLAPAPIAPPQEDPLPPDEGTEERPAPDPAVDGGAAPVEPMPIDCEPLPTKSVCMPPGYYGGPSTPGGDTGGENSAGEDPIAEPEEPPTPSEPSTDDGDAPGAEPDAGAPVSPPVTPEPEEEVEEPVDTEDGNSDEGDAEDDGKDEEDGPELAPVDDEQDSSDDGCNVAASGVNGSTNGVALAGLLGLVGLAFARRRRN
jgi:MYXO-CTERM domain-containing protein